MPTFVVRDKIPARTARLAWSLLVFFLWVPFPGARADVIVDCSEASLQAAAANGGSYTFNCGTNATTIILSNTIVVTVDLTLDGAGQGLVISGGNSVRLFLVNSNVHLTLKNLVLTNGKAAGADGTNGVGGGSAAGGAIYNDSGSVTLVNSTLSGHTAAGGNGGNGVVQLNGSGGKGGNGGNASGGAILNNGGSLWLTNCTFATNSGSGGTGGTGADATAGGNGNDGGSGGSGGSASGATIANVGGIVAVYDCTFSKNGVTGAKGGAGGNGTGLGSDGANGTPGDGLGSGLFNDGGTVTVLFSTFNGNTATGANGGNGKPGTTHEANGASGAGGSSGSGAGICNNGGVLGMTNCTFYGNSVVGGKGGNGGAGDTSGFGGDGGDGGPGGPGKGGAIFNAVGGRITAVNCTLSNNSAQGGPGGSGGAAGSIVAKAGLSSASGTNYGGGLAVGGGMFLLQNTLVGGSLSGGNAAGAIVDGGYNLSDDNSLMLLASGSKTVTNLLLGLLSSNGGPTQTVPLRPNSPAINAGNDAYCLPTDQRHYSRSGPCDIGAYEINATDPNARLTILLQANQVVFAWPTNSIGYMLQFTPGFSPPAWTTVANTPAVTGNRYVITNTVSASNRFYRLSR